MTISSRLLLDIDPSDIEKLTKFLKDKYKYDFTNYALLSFERRIQKILKDGNLSNVAELIIKLDTTPEFVHDFIKNVTVNVTEMFRDPSFWYQMRKEIIPKYSTQEKPVKIWHIGCSSGEEVYSMIITLKELGVARNLSVTATDIDREVIKKAKTGKYPLKKLTLNNKNYLKSGGTKNFDDYITKDNRFYYINKEIKQHVCFHEHNLVSDNSNDIELFDIILCRNVLIYFNQNLQNDVLETIHQNLQLEGCLAIGLKESLAWCKNFTKFTTVSLTEKIFKKTHY